MRRRIIAYLTSFLLVSSFPNAFYVYQIHRKNPKAVFVNEEAAFLRRKINFYKNHKKNFNFLFAGDSRTYLGIDPQDIDALLNASSYNLGAAGHWFATQYPMFLDLLPEIPKGTVLVWSIGHDNFHEAHEMVNKNYPIPLKSVPLYLKSGFSLKDIYQNVFAYDLLEPYCDLLPGFSLFARRKYFYNRFNESLSKDIGTFFGKSKNPPKKGVPLSKCRNYEAYLKIRKLYKKNPEAVGFEPKVHDGVITLVLVHKVRGSLLAIELEPDYYRREQSNMKPDLKLTQNDIHPDPRLSKLFDAMLDLLKASGVAVIVNEFQEAPYTYANPRSYEAHVNFMRGIEKKVRQKGFGYIRADFSQLKSDFYYDEDHFNQRGVKLYARLFAAEIERLRRKDTHAL